MKKAIITGPTGAVGNALIRELLEHNYIVTAICRPNSKRIESIKRCQKVEIVECDLCNLKELLEKLDHDYDVFYHLAWDGTFGDSRQDVSLQLKNVEHTIDAVRLAKNIGCKTFVGVGSQSEYGPYEGVLEPNTPCNPNNGYGIGKMAASLFSRIECNKLGIKHIWCRIISLYGPYDGEHTLVMSAIKSFIDNEKIKFTKGEQIWDYIYSKDAARAFRLVGEKGKNNSIYCIGTGRTKKLKEYITIIRDLINPNIDITFGELDYYPNQAMHLEAGIANLIEDTGFIPRYSFEEGMAETIDWFKNERKV